VKSPLMKTTLSRGLGSSAMTSVVMAFDSCFSRAASFSSSAANSGFGLAEGEEHGTALVERLLVPREGEGGD